MKAKPETLTSLMVNVLSFNQKSKSKFIQFTPSKHLNCAHWDRDCSSFFVTFGDGALGAARLASSAGTLQKHTAATLFTCKTARPMTHDSHDYHDVCCNKECHVPSWVYFSCPSLSFFLKLLLLLCVLLLLLIS